MINDHKNKWENQLGHTKHEMTIKTHLTSDSVDFVDYRFIHHENWIL